MKPLLEVKDISVEYVGEKRNQALEKVSFDVKSGEILGIIGESGSGKTTLAYSILNLLPESAKLKGSIIFKGSIITEFKENKLCYLRGKEIGIIPQDPAASFNPVFSVGYQFNEFLKVKGICKDAEERLVLMEEALNKACLWDVNKILNSYPHQLSGGQLQRAMIALVIAAKPSLLIADEPTSSLDVTIESQLVHMFLRLRDEMGFTIIFITHNLGLIEALCDRVVVLYQGQVKEMADKASIIAAPRDEYTKSLVVSFREVGE